MKILFFSSYPQFSGSHKMALRLAEITRAAGHEVIIGAPDSNSYIDTARQRDFETYIYQAPKSLLRVGRTLITQNILRKILQGAFDYAPYICKTAATLKQQKFDLIYIAQERGVMQIGPSAKLAGTPVLWHVQGGLPDRTPMIHRAAAALSAKIVCVSNAVRADISKFLSPQAMQKTSTMYNGIPDLEGKPPAPKKDSTTRLLFAGNVVPERGAHILIDAIANLPEDLRKHIHLDIFGWLNNAPYKAYLDQHIKKHGLEKHVTIHGFVENIRDFMSTAAIIICPTIERATLDIDGTVHVLRCKEGFGLTALEGMRAGKPVICSGIYGLKEVVEHHVTGLHVPSNDVHALTEAIEELINDTDKAAAYGQAGRKRYEAHFTMPRMETIFLEILEGFKN